MFIKITRLMQDIRENKKGFTLIELMVVIAVLGVIMALVLPNLFQSITKANIEKDKLNVSRVQTFVYQYKAIDKDGKYPADLDALKTGKFLTELPTLKEGSYSYSSTSGIVTYHEN